MPLTVNAYICNAYANRSLFVFNGLFPNLTYKNTYHLLGTIGRAEWWLGFQMWSFNTLKRELGIEAERIGNCFYSQSGYTSLSLSTNNTNMKNTQKKSSIKLTTIEKGLIKFGRIFMFRTDYLTRKKKK